MKAMLGIYVRTVTLAFLPNSASAAVRADSPARPPLSRPSTPPPVNTRTTHPRVLAVPVIAANPSYPDWVLDFARDSHCHADTRFSE